MKTSFPDILIIDNESADNFIAKKVINKLVPLANVEIFTDATKALEYIKREYSIPGADNTIILLDVMMPEMSGWEFMKKFEELDDKIQKYFTIYMLSGSDSVLDKARAHSHPKITDYILKPLTDQSFVPVIFDQIRKQMPKE